MAETKYGKYICTEFKEGIPLPPYREWERDILGDGPWEDGTHRGLQHIVWTDATVIPGAFYSEMTWQWPSTWPNQRPRPVFTKEQMEEMAKKPGGQGVPPHAHPFPELLCFFGTDVEHPEELNGEIEFWMEDEKYTFTKSFVIYIPANVTHCPFRILRMDKPFFHYTIGPGTTYI
jgi:hypothetical protein